MKYVNMHGYSDVHPYEVIRQISDTCLEIRGMTSVMDPSWKPDIIVGGFAGHCANNHSQRWIITSDALAPTLRIRKHKHGGWKAPGGNKFELSDTPRRFYDYNF